MKLTPSSILSAFLPTKAELAGLNLVVRFFPVALVLQCLMIFIRFYFVLWSVLLGGSVQAQTNANTFS